LYIKNSPEKLGSIIHRPIHILIGAVGKNGKKKSNFSKIQKNLKNNIAVILKT